MHKDFRLTNNDNNKVKRLFYNSTLVYSESVFPFHSSVPSNTEKLKNLRVNLAFYKDKLQNQYQKCRDYLKEEISQPTETSGILKEVVLENMCGESKRKLLNRIHNMGLRIKEAVGTKETLIMVDLSPISSNKEAVNKFMEFIDKERERLSKLKEKKSSIHKVKDVSIQKDLNLNCSYRKLADGKKVKTISFKNTKDSIIKDFNDDKQYNRSSVIKIYPKANTDENNHKVSNVRLLPSPRQPHYYEPNPSLFLESIYSPTSKDSKYDKNPKKPGPKKDRKLSENRLGSNSRDLQKIKSNNQKDGNNNSSKNQIHRANDGSLKTTNNKFENLFKSQLLPNLDNVEGKKEMTKKTKEKKKKNKINRIFNLLKYFFINKQKYEKKDKELINTNGGYSIISYHVETGAPRRSSERRSSVSFSPTVEIIENKITEPTLQAEETVEENIQNGKQEEKPPLLLNEPAIVWGREIWIDSKKEQEILSSHASNGDKSSNKVEDKQQNNDDKLSNKTTEVEKILKQQTKIKEMIENIHDTLKCQDTTSTDLFSGNSGYQSEYSDECYESESAASCKCDTNMCTSEVWSDKATVSNGSDSCWHKSFNESMTNIPNTSCWCIELCEKLRSLCVSWCKKSEPDTKIQNELLNQRREILRLNKILGRHLQNEHPTQSREYC